MGKVVLYKKRAHQATIKIDRDVIMKNAYFSSIHSYHIKNMFIMNITI